MISKMEAKVKKISNARDEVLVSHDIVNYASISNMKETGIPTEL